MDNGSSHRGQPCVRRLTEAYPNLVPVHGPIHASWLNQIEIYEPDYLMLSIYVADQRYVARIASVSDDGLRLRTIDRKSAG